MLLFYYQSKPFPHLVSIIVHTLEKPVKVSLDSVNFDSRH